MFARFKLITSQIACLTTNTRGMEDTRNQAEAFLYLYKNFYQTYQELEKEEREEFTNRANELLDDQEVGTVLGCGEEDTVKEQFYDLDIEDLEIVMKFLIEEEVIEFD